jgi:hypothetical protein
MELKIIDSRQVPSEVIESFATKMEDFYKSNELYDYNNSKSIITRRKFLQYSAVGSLGLAFPFLTTKEVEANPLLWRWLLALISGGIELYGNTIKSGVPVSGKGTLQNLTNETVEGQLVININARRQIDKKYIIKNQPRYAKIRLNPYEEIDFDFENGPVATARRDSSVYVSMKTKNDKKNSNNVTLVV